MAAAPTLCRHHTAPTAPLRFSVGWLQLHGQTPANVAAAGSFGERATAPSGAQRRASSHLSTHHGGNLLVRPLWSVPTRAVHAGSARLPPESTALPRYVGAGRDARAGGDAERTTRDDLLSGLRSSSHRCPHSTGTKKSWRFPARGKRGQRSRRWPGKVVSAGGAQSRAAVFLPFALFCWNVSHGGVLVFSGSSSELM